jgi:glycine cleavage system H protein
LLVDDPSLVNSDAEGEGWFFRLRLADPSELEGLMGADEYTAYVDSL